MKFGVEVFEIDYNLPKEVIANEAIHSLEDFLYKDLGLTSTLSELNIDDEYFEVMAKRVTQNGPIKGFVDLNYEDCLAIYKESL